MPGEGMTPQRLDEIQQLSDRPMTMPGVSWRLALRDLLAHVDYQADKIANLDREVEGLLDAALDDTEQRQRGDEALDRAVAAERERDEARAECEQEKARKQAALAGAERLSADLDAMEARGNRYADALRAIVEYRGPSADHCARLARAALDGTEEGERPAPSQWDARTANSADTREQALELAKAWADGRRSWTNIHHPDHALVAKLDAEEVSKWSALAAVLPPAHSRGEDGPVREATCIAHAASNPEGDCVFCDLDQANAQLIEARIALGKIADECWEEWKKPYGHASFQRIGNLALRELPPSDDRSMLAPDPSPREMSDFEPEPVEITGAGVECRNCGTFGSCPTCGLRWKA